MPTFFQTLENYLRVTASYWWLLLLGVTMPFIDGINWHLPDGRKLKLKPWHRLTITFIFLSAAQFLAYRNSQFNLYTVIQEKEQLSAQQSNKPPVLNVQIQPETPEDHALRVRETAAFETLARQRVQGLNNKQNQSPKKQIAQLSLDLLAFLTDRQRMAPQWQLVNSPNPENNLKLFDIYEKNSEQYQRETGSEYTAQFGNRVTAAFHKLRESGIDIRDFEDRCIWAGRVANIITLQVCAVEVGAFADKLSD